MRCCLQSARARTVDENGAPHRCAAQSALAPQSDTHPAAETEEATPMGHHPVAALPKDAAIAITYPGCHAPSLCAGNPGARDLAFPCWGVQAHQDPRTPTTCAIRVPSEMAAGPVADVGDRALRARPCSRASRSGPPMRLVVRAVRCSQAGHSTKQHYAAFHDVLWTQLLRLLYASIRYRVDAAACSK